MKRFFGLALLGLSVLPALAAQVQPNYYLIRYLPGENWNSTIDYANQPGLKAHHQYIKERYFADQVLMVGAVTGDAVALILVAATNEEEARAIVRTDPGIATQILKAEVIGWDVVITSMRFNKPVPIAPIEDPDAPFKLRRLDTHSVIKTRNQPAQPQSSEAGDP